MEEKTLTSGATVPYVRFYCEENVYNLLKQLLDSEDVGTLFAVFVSNAQRKVPLRIGPLQKPRIIVWDYHVIAVRKATGAAAMVYDFDCPFTLPVDAIRIWSPFTLVGPLTNAAYFRQFRVVPARTFIENLCTDRSHMLTCAEVHEHVAACYHAPPPPTPPIGTGTNLFLKFVDMSSTEFGQVMDEAAFLAFLAA